MDILGISAFYHDSAAVLLRDGIPIAAAQEERFSRRKNDASFPRRAVRFCLREGQIEPRDLDHVVFYEKPLRKFERILATHLQHFPRAGRAFSRAMFLWLGDRLWMKNRIANEVGIEPARVLFTEHHGAHAASAFFASPFEEAAVLTVDGVGEWATTTLARGQGNGLEILDEIHFPHSLGLLYSAITAFLGFEVNSGEQKVMGLAAFGRPSFEREIASLIRLDADGSFELDLAPFRFAFDPDRGFGEELVRRLGQPRMPGDQILYTGEDGRRHADIAASLQLVLERALLGLARRLGERVDSKNLCMAGGVALNVVANTGVLADGPFDRLFVQPAAGDAGGALGAALHVYHVTLGQPRLYVQEHAFLGEQVLDDPAEGAVELPDETAIVEETVRRLIAGKTVGWVQGRFEWGPRSLGHRSLLADPRHFEMKDHINVAVKNREPFRPFAPAVPVEAAATYYEIPAGGELASRYMLIASRVTPRGGESTPAAIHVDGTARVQLVDRSVDPLFHRLLTSFGEETGVPVLLNTSLNLRGDPICRGEADAVDLLRRSRLDSLVVENRLYDS